MTMTESQKEKWQCAECGKTTDRLLICWGMSGGQKVDVIEYFCPFCPSTELTFLGSKDELDAYWDMEWDNDD